MSAAYVPFGTSVVPPYFRGTVAYDAALVDALSGQIGFAAKKVSLWPPEDSHASSFACGGGGVSGNGLDAATDRTKVLVVPTQGLGHFIDPSDLVVVNGKFRSLLDFWAHPSVMKRGFVEGYQMMTTLIGDANSVVPRQLSLSDSTATKRKPKGIGHNTRSLEDDTAAIIGRAETLLESVMEEQSTWKLVTGFVKPLLWFERDPLFALFILAAAMIFILSYLASYIGREVDSPVHPFSQK